jgi:hypothetical protein
MQKSSRFIYSSTPVCTRTSLDPAGDHRPVGVRLPEVPLSFSGKMSYPTLPSAPAAGKPPVRSKDASCGKAMALGAKMRGFTRPLNTKVPYLFEVALKISY